VSNDLIENPQKTAHFGIVTKTKPFQIGLSFEPICLNL